MKLQIKDGGFDAYDDGGPGSNPAVRTKVQYLDGTEEEQFAFANFSGEMGRKRRLFMRLRNTGMVRDYFSDLQVIKDGAIVAEVGVILAGKFVPDHPAPAERDILRTADIKGVRIYISLETGRNWRKSRKMQDKSGVSEVHTQRKLSRDPA